MDKKTIAGIEQFLRRVDDREYIHIGRGKVVVQSDGDGRATVRILLSSIHEQVENPVLGPFDSVEDLCAGIFDALEDLSGEEGAESAYDHFIHMISRRATARS